MSSLSKFTRAGVREYEKRRYHGLDQRIVHAREMKLIRKMLDQVLRDDCVVRENRVVCDDQAVLDNRVDRVGRVVCDDQVVRHDHVVGENRVAAPPRSRPPGRMGSKSGLLALDLPCGYGRFTPLLRGRGFDVVGADLSVEMACRAAENAADSPAPSDERSPGEEPRAGAWFSSLAANAGRLPFQPGVFDLIFSIRFFHHVHTPEDRAAILREFHRVSAGYAVISFYRTNGLHVFQRRFRRLFGKSRTNIKMVEPGVFEKAAEEAGFEIVRIVPLFRGLHAYHLALLKKTEISENKKRVSGA